MLNAVLPAFGPIGGTTSLRVIGGGLRGGCDYRCRFSGEAGGANTGAGQRVVPATLDADTGDVLCYSSTAALTAAAVELLQVSLNGQQYSEAHLPFIVHSAPSVQSLSPSSGPAAGRTLVAVRLAQVWP